MIVVVWVGVVIMIKVRVVRKMFVKMVKCVDVLVRKGLKIMGVLERNFMCKFSCSIVDFFIVMDVMEVVCKVEVVGEYIIYMEVGQSGIVVFQVVQCVFVEIMWKDVMGYMVVLGLFVLCVWIVWFYGEWYNVDLKFEWIVVIFGSFLVFLLVFMVFFDVGDIVVIGVSGYLSYCQILKVLLFNLLDLCFVLENWFQFVLDDFVDLDIVGLMVVFLVNLIGMMLDKFVMQVLIDVIYVKGVSFISDEIYYGIEYEVKVVMVFELIDDCYVINFFLKYFLMIGWWIGWMVVFEDYVCMVE